MPAQNKHVWQSISQSGTWKFIPNRLSRLWKHCVNSVQSVSPSALSMQNLSNVQPLPISNGPNSAPNAAGQTTMSIQPVNTVQTKTFSGDPSIWLKEKWVPGEV